MSGGGGRTREGPEGVGGRTIVGGGIFNWGGCTSSQGGVGELGLWFG